MTTSTGLIRARLSDAGDGRVVVGIVVVLVSVLVLPVPVWLLVLGVAMASRPRDAMRSELGPSPALQRWLYVTMIFFGAAVLTAIGKPLTGLGLQLLIWFALLPAIGVLFLLQGRREHTIAAIWLGSTVAACSAGLVSIVQVGIFDDPRATGITANSITFGNTALLLGVISVALHRLVDLPRRLALPAALTAGTLGLIASILSGSRGGWLALPLLIAVLLWQERDELTPSRLARLALGLVCTLVFANTLSDGMPTSRASASVSNVSGYQTTAPRSDSAGSSEGARIEAWRSSSEAFADHPITGIGWGNLGTHFEGDVARGIRNERIATFDHAHHQLLGAAANGGLIGLTAMVALFAVPGAEFLRVMRERDRRRRTLGLTGSAVLGAYAVFGLTESVLENLVPVTILAVVIAALCAELDRTASTPTGSASLARDHLPPPAVARRMRPAGSVMHRWAHPFGLHS